MPEGGAEVAGSLSMRFYQLETCTDLIAAAWTNAGFELVGEETLDEAFDAVTNRLPAVGDTAFTRLRVEYGTQ